MTSPHENEEDEQKFFDKIRRRTSPNETPARRWNFAGPLQLTPTAHLSAPETVIAAFEATFSPERIRAVILSPDRHGNWLAQARIDALVTSLRTIPRTETIVVDARHRTANGLIYADFFDFT
ncbi:hypothetical protein STAQ_28020 [Allostella sp. ATCC 35155]|nr:hypothetical protein STAQ_28020 [Stella sp. ATCC 35155]